MVLGRSGLSMLGGECCVKLRIAKSSYVDMKGVPPISAKLFCKHSRVIFISYRVVLKNERQTSNFEH